MAALQVYACLANDAAPWQRHSEGVDFGLFQRAREHDFAGIIDMPLLRK